MPMQVEDIDEVTRNDDPIKNNEENPFTYSIFSTQVSNQQSWFLKTLTAFQIVKDMRRRYTYLLCFCPGRSSCALMHAGWSYPPSPRRWPPTTFPLDRGVITRPKRYARALSQKRTRESIPKGRRLQARFIKSSAQGSSYFLSQPDRDQFLIFRVSLC